MLRYIMFLFHVCFSCRSMNTLDNLFTDVNLFSNVLLAIISLSLSLCISIYIYMYIYIYIYMSVCFIQASEE